MEYFGWSRNLVLEMQEMLRRVTEDETSVDAETIRFKDLSGQIPNLCIRGLLHRLSIGLNYRLYENVQAI